MPEFAIIQQNAKKLSGKLTRHFISNQGCMSFFSAMVPSNSSIEEAITIGMLASTLDEANDKALQNYIEAIPVYSEINFKELEDYKKKVLIGMYLMKWFDYNSSSISSYLSKPLIEFFQSELEIKSPNEMDEQTIDESLEALSQYCSYIYANRRHQVFAELNQRLGISIQVDIYQTRNSKFIEDSTWYSLYSGMMSTFGMNKMS